MKTNIILAFCASLLIACGSGFTTPPITIPEITIPPFTFNPSNRPLLQLVIHTSAAGVKTYTLVDGSPRTPHRARAVVAQVTSLEAATLIRNLWNATVNVTP